MDRKRQGRTGGRRGRKKAGEKIINVYIMYKSVCVAIANISNADIPTYDITMCDIVKTDGASACTYSASTPRP